MIDQFNKKHLKQRGIWGKTKPVSTSIALPLIEAAQDEIREELRELWARMIAKAMDPDRASSVLRSFIETVKQFEPIDTLVLEKAIELANSQGKKYSLRQANLLRIL